MAQTRYKPTWEELKREGVLTPFGAGYVLQRKYLDGFLAFLDVNGIRYSMPDRLRCAQSLTESDYAEISVPKLTCCSRTKGEDDQLYRGALNSFKRKM